MRSKNYFDKIKELPETIKQLVGLAAIMIIIFLSFFILNVIFGEGDELVAKMRSQQGDDHSCDCGHDHE